MPTPRRQYHRKGRWRRCLPRRPLKRSAPCTDPNKDRCPSRHRPGILNATHEALQLKATRAHKGSGSEEAKRQFSAQAKCTATIACVKDTAHRSAHLCHLAMHHAPLITSRSRTPPSQHAPHKTTPPRTRYTCVCEHNGRCTQARRPTQHPQNKVRDVPRSPRQRLAQTSALDRPGQTKV